MKTKLSSIGMVVAMGLAAGSAQAAVNWAFGTTGLSATTGAVTVTASGYVSSVTTPGNLVASAPTNYGNDIGMCSTYDPSGCAAPSHALDNMTGYESLLLTFTSSVQLTALQLGYTQEGTAAAGYLNQGDISVLAYNGSTAPNMTGSSYSSINSNLVGATSQGWHLIGNYADVVAGTTQSLGATQTSTTTGISASYWLIAAYNSVFNGNSRAGSFSCNNDYVKLYSVMSNPTTPGRVPEPSALLLFGTALLGVVGLRRREKSIAA
jgi:hypothetical protein